MNKKQTFLNGLRDGIPIGLGYYAVAFSLGIIARKAGLNAVEGFFNSILARASAGEYAGLTMIITHATVVETFLVSFITNARYMLMTTALSQRFSPDTSVLKRMAVAFCMTDEIFGATIARPGYVIPQYTYGLSAIAAPLWGLGTASGIIAGGIMPARAVSALSVALYGMFIAIIIPPAKRERPVLICVIVSFLLSYLCSDSCVLPIPYVHNISAGTRTIILTVLISTVAALVVPVKEEDTGDA